MADKPVKHLRTMFKSKHVAHSPGGDHPVVHPLRDLYQEDKHFAPLFSASGQSEICGPTAMSNVLLYLKHKHEPPYPKLLNHIKDSDTNAHAVVETMFKICHTDRNNGTYAWQMKQAADTVFKNAGYGPLVSKDVGVWGQGSDKKPIGPAELRAASKTTFKLDAAPSTSDRAVTLLFGWYDSKTYHRHGGHFVALAGYDAKKEDVIYVTNPLIPDYPEDHVYSKVILKKVGAQTGALPSAGMWQTGHLFGDSEGIVAVLEEMVAVLPKL
jgi:hypothetical protein